MKIDIYLTPIPFGKVELEHKTIVIIDVLRSKTSICAAFTYFERRSTYIGDNTTE
ncbi:MAG: hypothetical protein GXO93_05265 [FCB group bacterium]|nr:hypothetical protein [FCB group bacterium]